VSTPIRRQYLELKQRYPETILFFRLGDFYETFDDDAKVVADELQITLTSKPMGKDLRVPLAGVPCIGDGLRDLQAAAAAGAQPMLVLTGKGAHTLAGGDLPEKTLVFDNLAGAVDHILATA
jgi:ribonucleotide monophosphatase NagD (HAD superfamily)